MTLWPPTFPSTMLPRRVMSLGELMDVTHHDACGTGFVAHLRGEKSRTIVEDALTILGRLSHRAAAGRDPLTGDGAGILLQLPHRFFKREGLALGFDMPRRRGYGVGQLFLPRDAASRAACERIVEEVCSAEGQRVLGWRDVPMNLDVAGPVAQSSMPVMRQVYVARRRVVPSAFERKLYGIRKLIEKQVRTRGVDGGAFHIASLSAETIVYKGLVLPGNLGAFFRDLGDPDMVAAIAVVHSRFSTNTRPTWDLAQPFRFIAHNGEINTVRGNRGWLHARRRLLQSAKFDGGVDRLWPILEEGKSDSCQFDNALELLVHGGRSLPHAMMMMIPEAWENDPAMDDDRRAFYDYASALIEPWDGPAAICFTDGHLVGATLDRNGLRPARFTVTHDDRVLLASEAGVLDVPSALIKKKGRLQPGRMFLVDVTEQRILEDDDVKKEIVSRFPYRRWLDKNTYTFDELATVPAPARTDGPALTTLQRAHGYTDDDLNLLLGPMAEQRKEPIGSMGNDAPIAVLSLQSPSLFDFFHQQFAQVTNPPIDPIREALVMTLATSIGPDGNTLEETPEQCHHINLPGPVLTNGEMQKLKAVTAQGMFESQTLSTLYELSGDDPHALGRALELLCDAAANAVDDGYNILVLSDRGVDATHASIPSLLALSAVHQRLVREGIRTHTGLVVEAADVREVHHVACLIGFGAAAVNPWLALDTLHERAARGFLKVDEQDAQRAFIQAVDDGLLKIMSKMGISTLQSYRGAQIFEAIGIDLDVIGRHFGGTPARIGGFDLAALDRENRTRHRRGFPVAPPVHDDGRLPIGGLYMFRREGEAHRWSPPVVHALQRAARSGEWSDYQAYQRLADEDLTVLRALLRIDADGNAPVPLEDVEPAREIVKRFGSGAISLGAISPEAHETLAIAMNRLGARSNSGEGGEEPHRYVRDANGDSRQTAIKQVASGRFGVTTEYLVHADEIQIKIAQGAKPGEGGQLPGHKVDERIGRVRHAVPGTTLISPPPHHDIYSIEDLKQLIWDLASVQPSVRIGVKLVSEQGVGTVAAGVVKAGACAVTIAGFSGGTGASPLSSLKHAGNPWELGLAEAQQVLLDTGLRKRVRVNVDGGLRTGRDVVIAALMGADEFGLATGALIAGGCVMQRRCHLNTCGVGVATQDPELRKKYVGKPEHIVAYFLQVAEDVRHILASLGARTLDEVIGRVEWLKPRTNLPERIARVDLAPLLRVPTREDGTTAPVGERGGGETRVDVSSHLDHEILLRARGALDGERMVVELPVRNVDRAVGALLSGEIARRHGHQGLGDDTLHVRLTGSAGQSFGAFCAHGVTLELFGEANDGVAKGLSGGRVIIRPPKDATWPADENVIIGNVALYGATSGDLYVAGIAGERFAVRNSGARAVVEGVGDHGCEYMTGGAVVVLGRVGRNFAAGMSGGLAFVLDAKRALPHLANLATVELLTLDDDDAWLMQGLLERHHELTGSVLARRTLASFDIARHQFVKVLPHDYKRALEKRRDKLRDTVAAE